MRSRKVAALGIAAALVAATAPATAAPAEAPEITVCSGQATIHGTSGNDVLQGTAGDDIIEGGNGDDVIDGAGGNDLICGGNGKDTLTGGPGADALHGGNAADLLVGDDGGDALYGENGPDELRAGAGNDTNDGGEGPDVCTDAETTTACDDTDLPRETDYSQAFDGPAGVHAEVRSSTEIDAWDLRIRRDDERSALAASMQASYAYDFDITDPSVDVVEADITIPYSAAALGDYDPRNLRIHYFDEKSGLWRLASDAQTVNRKAGTVTATVNHFSIYTLMRLPDDGFGSYWDTKPVWCVPEGAGAASNLDVAFAIDTSGSMATYDPNGMRVTGALEFLSKMNSSDRAGVVDFDGFARVIAPMTQLDTKSNVDSVKAALESTRDQSGGTDITAAVRTTTDLLAGASTGGRPKIALLLTDGESDYDYSATDAAIANNVVFYTIGLGRGVDPYLLQRIADDTGGRYLPMASAEDLPKLYAELAEDLIDSGDDWDEDGLSDCIERRGALVAPGFYKGEAPDFASNQFVNTEWQNWDSDGDLVSDGDELGPVLDLRSDPRLAQQYDFLISAGLVRFWNPVSDPNLEDSEGERLHDPDEVTAGTNAFMWDTDHDTASDYEEIVEGYDPTSFDPFVAAGVPLPGMSPLTLFMPTSETSFEWPYDILPWDPETKQCVAECGAIYDAAQALYAEKSWPCKLFTTCDIDDLREDIIMRAVDSQGVFTHEGYLTTEYKVDWLLAACIEAAADGAECTSDRIESAADDEMHYAELVEAALVLLDNLPGGRRQPNERVDAARTKLDDIAKQACRDTPRLEDELATAWGRRVHNRFNELVESAGDATLFGETGYLKGQVVEKNGSVWPKGTTAPDAVFGTSRSAPEAFFDLKAGEKGILASWIDRLKTNVVGLVTGGTTPVFTLRC